jgi:hypothetical protein
MSLSSTNDVWRHETEQHATSIDTGRNPTASNAPDLNLEETTPKHIVDSAGRTQVHATTKGKTEEPRPSRNDTTTIPSGINFSQSITNNNKVDLAISKFHQQ